MKHFLVIFIFLFIGLAACSQETDKEAAYNYHVKLVSLVTIMITADMDGMKIKLDELYYSLKKNLESEKFYLKDSLFFDNFARQIDQITQKYGLPLIYPSSISK